MLEKELVQGGDFSWTHRRGPPPGRNPRGLHVDRLGERRTESPIAESREGERPASLTPAPKSGSLLLPRKGGEGEVLCSSEKKKKKRVVIAYPTGGRKEKKKKSRGGSFSIAAEERGGRDLQRNRSKDRRKRPLKKTRQPSDEKRREENHFSTTDKTTIVPRREGPSDASVGENLGNR